MSCPVSCGPIFALTKAQCIGVLGIQAGLQALRMSFFRLAGSPGESDPNSDLNRHYLAQQLTAEWNPLGMVLILAGRMIGNRGKKECCLQHCVFTGAANLFVISRLGFTAGCLYFPQHHKKFGMPTMIGTYLSVFTMGGILAAQCHKACAPAANQ